MNIAVYAICHNQAPFIHRWAESMGEADAIYVLDAGSQDGSPELLRQRGIQVREDRSSLLPFDAARNRSLALVPEDMDVCVCTNLDERFRPGWRNELERAWLPWAQQALFPFTCSAGSRGDTAVTIPRNTIHARRGFRWQDPVREVLTYTGRGEPVVIYLPSIHLERFPDPRSCSPT